MHSNFDRELDEDDVTLRQPVGQTASGGISLKGESR